MKNIIFIIAIVLIPLQSNGQKADKVIITDKEYVFVNYVDRQIYGEYISSEHVLLRLSKDNFPTLKNAKNREEDTNDVLWTAYNNKKPSEFVSKKIELSKWIFKKTTKTKTTKISISEPYESDPHTETGEPRLQILLLIVFGISTLLNSLFLILILGDVKRENIHKEKLKTIKYAGYFVGIILAVVTGIGVGCANNYLYTSFKEGIGVFAFWIPPLLILLLPTINAHIKLRKYK